MSRLSHSNISLNQATTEKDYLSFLPRMVIEKKEKQRLIEADKRRKLLKKSIKAWKQYNRLKSRSYIQILLHNLILSLPPFTLKAYLKAAFKFQYNLLLIPLKLLFYPIRSLLKLLRSYGFMEQISRKEIILITVLVFIFLLLGILIIFIVRVQQCEARLQKKYAKLMALLLTFRAEGLVLRIPEAVFKDKY